MQRIIDKAIITHTMNGDDWIFNIVNIEKGYELHISFWGFYNWVFRSDYKTYDEAEQFVLDFIKRYDRKSAKYIKPDELELDKMPECIKPKSKRWWPKGKKRPNQKQVHRGWPKGKPRKKPVDAFDIVEDTVKATTDFEEAGLWNDKAVIDRFN